ncbi:extracellular solute-binding protein [Algisphaera agarilytica]|uniref:Multiple sugar transport system substrate-binding protein n=1 Tax=Algisphaera agarilytica TaxID=1385975 RepID=A0A7X0H5B8_9BACT|nr:extracellular solute-binding protein [Algisphaera agarilytica]MBB6429529.1 multiple sugar transport system substrate-binding protein [Algisphaera agarilytica]
MREDTLRFAIRQFEPFERSMQEIWDAFCAQTGCTLKFDPVPMDLHPLYDALIGDSGMKNGDWDVAHLNTDFIAEAHHQGALLNLKPFIEQNPPHDFPSGWTDSMLGFQDFGDAIVGLPFHDGPECLIYRTDLFNDPKEQADFKAKTSKDLAPPKTWDDFVEVARFFQRPEQGLYGTAFAAYPDGHNTVFDLAIQIWTRGGELVNEQGRVVVDSPEALEGLTFYREILRDTTVVHPKCAEMDSVQSGLAFAQGEIAMMVNWFGFAGMGEVAPDSKVKGKLDITDIPAAPGHTSASLNCYWMYVVGAGSPHAQVAYDFIRFATSAENDKRLTLNGGTGCRISSWHDTEINQEVPFYHRLEPLHATARTLPRLADWASLAGAIDELVVETINTDKPIKALLEAAQAKIDAS